jgi:gliding motility-associated-like protein
MYKRIGRLIFLFSLLFLVNRSFCQDVDLYITGHYLPGKSIIKLNRDFYDGYMWILAKNNEIYRLNTITNQLDNYTTQFQQFNNFQIFDIAAIDSNRVTFAIKNSDSTVLVNYRSGGFIYPLRNNFYGIKGNITSIGTASYATQSVYGYANFPGVLIATDKGFYQYIYDNGNVNWNGERPSQIYSATYRDQMFIAEPISDTTGVNLITAMAPIYGSITGFNATLRTGGLFGDLIKTAYVTANELPNSLPYYTPDVFWGNSNGLFHEKSRNDHPFLSRTEQYLNNININKITDIFGLTAFGNSVAKENLLIGTDNGLYYSSSFLHAGLDTSLDKFTLYHFDQLGNIPVTSIEVNAKSAQAPFCEDGIWLATNNGFYLVRPDFAAYLDTGKLVNSIQFKNSLDTAAKKICAGDSIVIQTNVDVSATSIQWFKDGQPLLNANKPTFTINATGDYYAILFDPCQTTHLQSNHLKVNVISGPVFSFNYPDKIQQCNSKPNTLKTDYSSNYHYRWYTNGTLNGNTTSQYIVSRTGKYKVEVSACTNSWVTSKEVEVDLINLPFPQITANKSNYCAGDMASLSVNIPVDTNYTINWYRDGVLLPAYKNVVAIKDTTPGSYTVMVNSNIFNCSQTAQPLQIAFTPSPVFAFNYPDELQYCKGTALALTAVGSTNYQYRWYKDGTLTGDLSAVLSVSQAGKYKVEVSACPGSWVPSKEVQVDFIQLAIPIITTDKPAYCIGDNATFSVNILPNQSSTINWYKDNTLLAANSNKTTLVTNLAGIYAVSIVNNTANSDGTTCSQISAVQSLSFNPPPTVSIAETVETSLCDGQAVDLAANYAGGSVKWSTGETSDNITVSKSGNYKLTVTSPAGCQADTSINISFLTNPVFTLKDTTICTYKRQSIMLTAPSGFSQYAWNGETGQQTYLVSQPQKLRLTVTDANGCQATQDIKIVEQCPEIYIPNAFTPNHDGINDTWAIAGLENDQTVEVQVMNRYGIRIFESKGYNIPWDGKYGSQKIATGVYYYIITAKNRTQRFSGSVMVIY